MGLKNWSTFLMQYWGKFKEFTSNELLIFILLQYGRFMCYRVCKSAPIDLSIKSTGFIQPTCYTLACPATYGTQYSREDQVTLVFYFI